MKVLVMSDSHGRNKMMDLVIEKEKGLDHIIHLGDLEGAEDYLEAIAPCPVDIVCGNNDFFTPYPNEKVVLLGDHKAFITHGHFYGVSMSSDRLVERAKEKGCDIAMYGHTHCPLIEQIDGVTVLNPGSVAYPRQENFKPSYAIMETDEDGHVGFSVNYVNA